MASLSAGRPILQEGGHRDHVADLFEGARRAGAEEGRAEDLQGSGPGFRAFAGTARTLAGAWPPGWRGGGLRAGLLTPQPPPLPCMHDMLGCATAGAAVHGNAGASGAPPQQPPPRIPVLHQGDPWRRPQCHSRRSSRRCGA